MKLSRRNRPNLFYLVLVCVILNPADQHGISLEFDLNYECLGIRKKDKR
jgi:hypothetical protein